MGLFDGIRRALVGGDVAALREELRQSNGNVGLLSEALAEAERQRLPMSGAVAGLLQESLAELDLSMEDHKWLAFSRIGTEFDRRQLGDIWRLSLLMYLANPLINRAVNLQSYYVWGQGVGIKAKTPLINEVVQAFLDDPKNQAELTSHQSRTLKEVDLQVYGNLFFVLFTDAEGYVLLRTIPALEIADISANPEDRKDVWYYKRQWQRAALDMATGNVVSGQQTAYYPDWRYKPEGGKPDTIGGASVEWDTPVYHVKVGGMADMRFGVPEIYQAIDWARAYNHFLEDVATLMRAYSRFAMAITTPGKAGTAAALAMFGTTVGSIGGTSSEMNPPPVVGSTFVGTNDYKLGAVRTAGATTSAEEGRRFLLMVCAATGLPESFFGDVSVGTLATAKSLDRPTELKFSDRRTLWADVLHDILAYVIDKAVAVGRLPEIDPDTGEDIDRHIDISFPPILEHSITESVQAIVSAATLDGKAAAGTIPDTKILSRMLLTALGQEDVDEVLAGLFPEGETPPTEAMTEAVRELRAALAKMQEG